MPTTPVYALRYPAATDPADVPTDIQKLALDVDALLKKTSYGPTPPASPADGDFWCFPADAANGVRWQFQYNAGSASAFKWEFIGGAELVAPPSGSVTIGTGLYVQLTGGPTLTIPRAGDYDLALTDTFVQVQVASTADINAGISFGGANPPSPTRLILAGTGQAFGGAALYKRTRFASLTAGTVLTAGVSASASTTFTGAGLRAQPVRIS